MLLILELLDYFLEIANGLLLHGNHVDEVVESLLLTKCTAKVVKNFYLML